MAHFYPTASKRLFMKLYKKMNYLTLYGNLDMAKHQQEWLVNNHGLKTASECIRCGKCEEACPQHIHIREELEKVAKALG